MNSGVVVDHSRYNDVEAPHVTAWMASVKCDAVDAANKPLLHSCSVLLWKPSWRVVGDRGPWLRLMQLSTQSRSFLSNTSFKRRRGEGHGAWQQPLVGP